MQGYTVGTCKTAKVDLDGVIAAPCEVDLDPPRFWCTRCLPPRMYLSGVLTPNENWHRPPEPLDGFEVELATRHDRIVVERDATYKERKAAQEALPKEQRRNVTPKDTLADRERPVYLLPGGEPTPPSMDAKSIRCVACNQFIKAKEEG